jgi:hypothetical protein
LSLYQLEGLPPHGGLLRLEIWPVPAEGAVTPTSAVGGGFHGVPAIRRQRRRTILTYRLSIITTHTVIAVFDPDEWLILDDPTLS